MKVFVTGATGFIGSAIVQELIGAGHQVLGLARSDKSADALIAAGAEVHRGSLDDLDSLKRGAAAADGVIHTAYNHDFSQYIAAGQTDREAIEALASALTGTNRPLIVTAGLAGLSTPGRFGTEDDTLAPSPRQSEDVATELAAKGVHTCVVRLAPSVHDDGDQGFVPFLIHIARQKGESPYIGDGQNRWAAVHRLDAAHLFRLALEKGESGAKYHGAGDHGIPFRDIAEVIGRHLNVPVVSKTPDEAPAHFDWMARFAALDMAASSALTQQRLGWKPTHKGLLVDLEEGTYFKG